MVTAVFAAVAVVLVVLTAAAVADLRRMRHVPAEPTPWQMRLFRTGPIPPWENAPLTAGEERAFAGIAAAEHDWIGDAVKGRKDGETRVNGEAHD